MRGPLSIARVSPRGEVGLVGGAAALVIFVTVVLSGCATITAVDLNNGSDAGSDHQIVLMFKADRSSVAPVRGVIGIRIPETWEVKAVTFTGRVSGAATRSTVMEGVYASEWESAVGPGYNGHKAGYEWWVGYGPAETWVIGDEVEVTCLVDTHGRGGTYLLDFVGGIADQGPELSDIEDEANDHALWYIGSAGPEPTAVLLDEKITLYSFTDVRPDTAYYEAIQGMASLGLVQGYPTGSGRSEFRPANSVYRAQYAKMIDGALGLLPDEDMVPPVVFTDLGADDPASLYPHEYVWMAYSHGIVKGYPNGTFKPYTPIVRGHVVTMTVRALQALHAGVLEDPPLDYQQGWGRDLLPEHRANAAIAEYNGLLDGLSLPAAAAGGDVSMLRGEVAQVLWNTMALVGR